MTDDAEPTFSVEDGIATQKRMREALGLGPEAFPLPAFIGMISDEIEQLRATGRSDADISAMVHDATGKTVTPADIAEHYAAPARRRRDP